MNAPDAEPDVLPQEKTKGILEAKTVYKKAKHEIFRTKRKKTENKKTPMTFMSVRCRKPPSPPSHLVESEAEIVARSAPFPELWKKKEDT